MSFVFLLGWSSTLVLYGILIDDYYENIQLTTGKIL